MQQIHDLWHFQYQDCIASDGRVTNKRYTVRDFEENVHGLIKYYPGICPLAWGQPWNTSVGKAGVLAEMWKENKFCMKLHKVSHNMSAKLHVTKLYSVHNVISIWLWFSTTTKLLLKAEEMQ
jgi:hypothetical protein